MVELVTQHGDICVGGESELTYNVNRDGILDNAHIDDWLAIPFERAREIALDILRRRRESKRHGQVKVKVKYDANGQPEFVLLRDMSILSS